MATGALDANGIWQYGEDDSNTTFSALLNRLGSSTSTQIAKALYSGRVIQTVVTTKSTTFSASTLNVWTDVTGLSATITPRFSTSKILVIVNTTLGGATLAINYLRTLRNGTVIGVGASSGQVQANAQSRVMDTYTQESVSWAIYDEPATTSSITYKVQVGSNVVNAAHVNRSDNDSSGWNAMRPISTITLLEIAS